MVRELVLLLLVLVPLPKPGAVAVVYYPRLLPKYPKDYSRWWGPRYGCSCHTPGSERFRCDIVSGQCQCRPHVVGRTCSRCQIGFWNIHSGRGCDSCQCDSVGSVNQSCSARSGQCHCRPGVGGPQCDQCLPGYFGFSASGCKECDRCDKPGHICDPDTGRCVCPPLTEGDRCQRCLPNTWGFEPNKGCKTCSCHAIGSEKAQCDSVTGRCICREGFEGDRCNACSAGYYGFPTCRRCDCDPAGTELKHCDFRGRCYCDTTGQCPCKENVTGRKCNQCKEGTFGLQAENPQGCTPCFCFGRATSCTQDKRTWSQLWMPYNRILLIEYDSAQPPFRPGSQMIPVNTQEICYINLAMPGSRELTLNGIGTGLNLTNNLRVIPGVAGNVKIGTGYLFETPIYWQLPKMFLGDKVLSYSGYLRFTVQTEGGTTLLPASVLDSYPLVQLQGNDHLVLEYFPFQYSPTGRYNVRFHEALWRMKNNPTGRVSRAMMMVALQKVQHIFIRATDSVNFNKAFLKDVTLDYAVKVPGLPPPLARGIELCECPPEYNSTSCQNPSIGFYRWYKSANVSSTIIIDLVGEARPCQCNGRSNVCDTETGVCLDCSQNTAGAYCNICASGFYGDPQIAPCRPCPCPTTERNFAETCIVQPGRPVICHCKQGYTGERCDRCSYGYYGMPQKPGGSCIKCQCDPYGSVSDECHEITGQCNCRAGITGRDCTQCTPRHIVTQRGCTSCDDGCTGVLLDKVDNMSARLMSLNVTTFVPAPWEKLFEVENHSLELNTKLRNYLSLAESELPDGEVEKLKKGARQQLNRAKRIFHRADNKSIESEMLHTDAKIFLDELGPLRRNIDDTVAYLKNYALGETPSVNVASALAEAENLLHLIKQRNLTLYRGRTEYELSLAEDLLKKIQGLLFNKTRVEHLQDELSKFQLRLDDLNASLMNAVENIEQTDDVMDSNEVAAEKLKSKAKQIDKHKKDIQSLMSQGKQYNEDAQKLLVEAGKYYEDIFDLRKEIQNFTNKIEHIEGILARLNPIYKEKYVIPAEIHANNLLKQAKYLQGLFVGTKQEADVALRAALAYQKIVDALEEARKAAINASIAADNAFKKVYPPDKDFSLLDRAKKLLSGSKDILEFSKTLQNRLNELQRQLGDDKKKLAAINDSLASSNISNQELNRQLGLQESGSKRAKEVTRNASSILSRAEDVISEVKEVEENVNKILRPRLNELANVGTLNLDMANSHILQVHRDTKELKDLTKDLKSKLNTTTQYDSIRDKLAELRSKIMSARHAAQGIKLSLTSKRSTSGGCLRTYHLSEPSTISSVVLTYAIAEKENDSQLFYLPSPITKDFIAIEMVNRQIRFLWNVGGEETGVVTHPEVLTTASEDYQNDEHWYRIEAERIGNIGRLRVDPLVSHENAASSQPEESNSDADYRRFDVNQSNLTVYIGAAGSPHREMKAEGFYGCLHQVTVDGRPIGLWNFVTNEKDSCVACIEGPEPVKDEGAYSFNGEGYSVQQRDKKTPYDKRRFSASLRFKTFDEDSLLFLVVNSEKGQYIALLLKDGRVQFRVGYGGGSSLNLETSKRYNTGNWTHIEATRFYVGGSKPLERGKLEVKIGGESEDKRGSPVPHTLAPPNIGQSDFYIGGIPPGFLVPSNIDFELNSFLGCLRDIEILQEGFNPTKGTFYGIEGSCPDKFVKTVCFEGKGYLEMNSHSLKRKYFFSFLFKTRQENTMLLLSTFEGNDNFLDSTVIYAESEEEDTNLIGEGERPRRRTGYYSVSLSGGKINVKINSGQEELNLGSEKTYNDGAPHILAIIKNNVKKVKLLIDDEEVDSGNLRENNVPAPSIGGLFFGGLPPHINGSDMLASTSPLIGCIQDVNFNNELLNMNKPVSFKGAGIGRTKVRGALNDSFYIPSVETLQQCQKVHRYTVEEGATKFGDKPDSYVQIDLMLRKRNLGQQLNVTFDFRTHYPNGILFVIKGKKDQQFFMASLRNEDLSLTFHGKKRQEIITASDNLNDGTWKTVTLVKKKKRTRITINGKKKKHEDVRINIKLQNAMFLGGLPSGENIFNIVMSQSEYFKGCIRNLHVNSKPYDLAAKVHHNVGQCFPTVEGGSFFQGDAYAIYSKPFHVGSLLDMELEFRTSEQTGLLLSVSEPQGYPALSLELYQGKVVLAVDMGDRHPFNATQSFVSQYYVCDNKWHKITARYENTQLTLKVDNEGEQLGFGFSRSGNNGTNTASPLYIGGLPDTEPEGTLKTRENFRGCIRNVVINGGRRDWTDMDSLHNVLLSSCPVNH